MLDMSYKLRMPPMAELRQVFGSYVAALEKTGGDPVVACFLIANPSKIGEARRARKIPGMWSDELKLEADHERAEQRAARYQARVDAALKAWRETGSKRAAMKAGKFGRNAMAELIRQSG